MFALGVVTPDLVHGEVVRAAGAGVAAGVTQAACDGLEGHVAGLQERPTATGAALQVGATARAGVVAGLAEGDGRPEVVPTHRAPQHLEHALAQGVLRHWATATEAWRPWLALVLTVLTDGFRDFPQSLQASAGMVPYLKLSRDRFLPHPSHCYYRRCIVCEQLTASLNKPRINKE